MVVATAILPLYAPLANDVGMTSMENVAIPFALVVDDNPLILMIASEILTEAGFRVLSASSGDEALEFLERHGSFIILLFSDVTMPGTMDGFMLAQIAADRWPHIRTILASGQANPGPKHIPESATFIEKPFTEAALISLVEHMQMTNTRLEVQHDPVILVADCDRSAPV